MNVGGEPSFGGQTSGPNFDVLAEMEMAELNHLQGTLQGPWSQAIQEERQHRQDILTDLARHRPAQLPESRGEVQDPTAYLTQLRGMNSQRSPTPDEINRFPEEKEELYTRATHFLIKSGIGNRLRIQTDCPVMTLNAFLASNLQATFIAPKALALREYEQRRNAWLSAHLSGLDLTNHTVKPKGEAPIALTKEHLLAAQNSLDQLTYATPAPDFFQLDEDQQDTVFRGFVREWREVCETALNCDRDMLSIKINRIGAPLAFYGPEALTEALGRYEGLDSTTIVQRFLRHPQNFQAGLEELYVAHQQGQTVHERQKQEAAERERDIKAYAKSREAVRAAQEAEKEARSAAFQERSRRANLTKNQRALEDLLTDPQINPNVLELTPGDSVYLAEADHPIRALPFESLINSHVDLIGRAIFEGLPQSDTMPSRLGARYNLGELLRAGHYGALRNLKITRLYVTEEDLEVLKQRDQATAGRILRESVSRLAITFDIQSGSKPPTTALGTFLVYVALPPGPGKAADILRTRPESTSRKIIESLRWESESIGTIMQGVALSRAYSAGLIARSLRRH